MQKKASKNVKQKGSKAGKKGKNAAKQEMEDAIIEEKQAGLELASMIDTVVSSEEITNFFMNEWFKK